MSDYSATDTILIILHAHLILISLKGRCNYYQLFSDYETESSRDVMNLLKRTRAIKLQR